MCQRAYFRAIQLEENSMMSTLKSTLALFVLWISIAQAMPTQPLQNREKSSASSDNETGGNKTTIAITIGLGLTTFFVVFLGFFMVRGYRNMEQMERTADTQPNDVRIGDHAVAKDNLGLNGLPE